MAENPYESSFVRSTGEDDQPRFRISAVLLGVLADIGSSLVAGVLLGIGVAISLGAAGGDPDAIAEKMETMPVVVYGGFLIGTLGSMLGGYVSALLAKVWPIQHALATGVVSTLLGLAFALAFSMNLSSPQSVISMGVVIPAALLGGYVYTRQRGPLPPDPRDVI